MQILEELIKNPLFGILLTLVAYEIAVMLYNKTKFVLLNPLLVSIIIIIAFLMITGIDYNDYNIGGSIITMFISPITVVLAVPLYLQINVLREHAPVILAGITLGCITAVGSMCAFQHIFNLDTQLFMSLVPKSVTTAIAVEVSSSLGGVPAITVIAVLVAGLFGAIFAPMMGKLFGIKNEIALGLA
ncbi:MAG: LrgB family protein, partial [Clostridia bacterium]